MRVVHSSVGSITEKGTQSAPETLSADELRLCFPGAVEFVGSQNSTLQLPDVALFGVLHELAAMWSALCSGVTKPSRTDLYGAYSLSLTLEHSGQVLLTEEWHGETVSFEASAFVDSLAAWKASLFASARSRHPSLAENGDFAALESEVSQLLRTRLPGA